MSSYDHLAKWYDRLTDDVNYEEFADFFESIFNVSGQAVHEVLDMACGTGTLTWMLAMRGYEMIGMDASAEMLAEAANKAGENPASSPPLLLCQKLSEMDLYGTVDAAVCSLDGMNYIPPHELEKLFRRLSLFISPGGVLAFDLNTPERLKSLDGQIFIDETEDILCLWRAEYEHENELLFYGMDIFSREGDMWDRESEEHVEYAHNPEKICALLKKIGFVDVCVRTDGPRNHQGRIFITAINGEK